MSGRVFEAGVARGIAPDDRARQERLKATARALVTAVRDGLVRDGVVRLHGFGTFRLRPVAARRGRHPRTGEPIQIPAGWRVVFRPAKALRERVEPDRAPSLPIGEPHASREAMLAVSAVPQARQPDAGRIPVGAPAAGHTDEWPRTAAAAMPEAKLSAHGPVPPGTADLEADSRVTRSPAALTRAPAMDAVAVAEPTPYPPPGEEAAVEPSEDAAVAHAKQRRRPGYRWAALVLLLLLAAGLGWLFRPAYTPAPTPPIAEEPAGSTGGQAPADPEGGAPDSGAPDTAATSGAGVSGDTQTAASDPEAAGTAGGEAATGDREARAEVDAEAPASATIRATDARVPPPAPEPTQATDGGDMTALSRAGGATTPAPSAEVARVDEGVAPDDAAVSSGETAGAEASSAEASSAEASSAEASSAEASGAPWFDGRDYRVRSGDTLWDLADRHYVNPYYWPHIWHHNTDIENPDRLEVHQGLWLPTLEGEPQSLTEADRRSIAEGYLLLYRFFREQGDANPQYALVGVRYFDPSVLPERLRGTAAGRPGDTLAAAFQARLEAEFPLD